MKRVSAEQATETDQCVEAARLRQHTRRGWNLERSRNAHDLDILALDSGHPQGVERARQQTLGNEGVEPAYDGGKAKTGGIESLRAFFPRIRKAYLIGEAAAEFAATLANQVPHEIAGTLDNAVAAAARDAAVSAAAEPVVLLSPACASFDQYRNFEVRGDAFRALVRALPGLVAK